MVKSSIQWALRRLGYEIRRKGDFIDRPAEEPAAEPVRDYPSETSKHRDVVCQYCVGAGLDVGFGGDPVSKSAVRMDLPRPYANTGDNPVQLPGDCRDLQWFRDGALDYVYSSHLLEDFDERETEPILREWLRVVRPGGVVVLLLPDQQRYVTYCRATGQFDPTTGIYGNAYHSIDRFSMEYMLETVARIEGAEVAARHDVVGDYSFVLVVRKRPGAQEMSQIEDLRQRLHAALSERDELKMSARDLRRQLAKTQA